MMICTIIHILPCAMTQIIFDSICVWTYKTKFDLNQMHIEGIVWTGLICVFKFQVNEGTGESGVGVFWIDDMHNDMYMITLQFLTK